MWSGNPPMTASKVANVVALFWVTKAMTTAFGESTSDWLVHSITPVLAVAVGFVFFLAAITVQLRTRRYIAAAYWFAVAMVGVFGTMAADVLHVAFHVPYLASAIGFAIVLAAVFVVWYRVEGTLSVHTIVTRRRELFYWCAVVATFALGTALGDLMATTFGLGYLGSVVLFAALITIPAAGYRLLHWNAVASFWSAYVLTRPLGASVADWLGKPVSSRGLGLGAGLVTAIFGVVIVVLVSYLAISHADDPQRSTIEPARA
jgi:uncharacterized membrane-anchored protein